MVLTALFRALPQIFLPGIRAVLWRTLALTALFFAGLAVALWFGVRLLAAQLGWLPEQGLFGALVTAIVIGGLAWILFRAVAMAIVGLYSDRIVEVVEQTSYAPRHALARVVPVTEGLHVAIRSLLRALGWNLAAIPAYLLLIATGIGAPLLFLVLNAYLLGRDLSELVEGRHPDLPRFTAGERWQLGFVSALLFLPPVVNLLAPIWSVAMATHMFHGRKTS